MKRTDGAARIVRIVSNAKLIAQCVAREEVAIHGSVSSDSRLGRPQRVVAEVVARLQVARLSVEAVVRHRAHGAVILHNVQSVARQSATRIGIHPCVHVLLVQLHLARHAERIHAVVRV